MAKKDAHDYGRGVNGADSTVVRLYKRLESGMQNAAHMDVFLSF
jgi:hypothetical protein